MKSIVSLLLAFSVLFLISAEANNKKNKLPDNPPRGTVGIEHLEREQEAARKDGEAIAFIFGKNPNSVKEPKVNNNNNRQRNRQQKKDPEIEAIEGIIRDLERGARLIYLSQGAQDKLPQFVRAQQKKKNKGKKNAYGIVFNADLTAYYGTVTSGDWAKAEKNRDRAGDEIFERFKDERPLAKSR